VPRAIAYTDRSFAHTFWYALALSAVALIPAAILAVEERRTRRRASRRADDETAPPVIAAV
jgi:hypothetical protein